MNSQGACGGVRALTSSQPPGVGPGCGQIERPVSQSGHWHGSGRATHTDQGYVSLCALQEHPRAPRWPYRVPSLAGTGQSSSSGRPATSTGTAPREKTRASYAVSNGWSLPTSPQPMLIALFCPHHPLHSNLDNLPYVQCH